MLNFDLTEEQQMIRKTIRAFADDVVAPGAIDRDRTKEFPVEVFKQLSEMGMMGLPFPEQYGGGGADTVSFAIVTEELSRACASTGITYSAHISLGGAPLNLFGTEEQKQAYLTPICTGESFGAFGLRNRMPDRMRGGRRRPQERTGMISSSTEQSRSSQMPVMQSIWHLPLLRGMKAKKEISAIIVPTNAEGFTVIDKYEKMGLNASNTTELVFDNVRVPQENLLGKRGNGFRQFLVTLDGGRIGIGAMAVGIAQAAFDRALSYSKERKQFGKRHFGIPNHPI